MVRYPLLHLFCRARLAFRRGLRGLFSQGNRATVDHIRHVFIGPFLTQYRDKDWDGDSQSGPGFSGSLEHKNDPFTGSVLNLATGEDGAYWAPSDWRFSVGLNGVDRQPFILLTITP